MYKKKTIKEEIQQILMAAIVTQGVRDTADGQGEMVKWVGNIDCLSFQHKRARGVVRTWFNI